MVKINLLPREERRRRLEIKVPQTAIVVLAALVVGTLLAYGRSVRREAGRLRAETVEMRIEIAKNQQVAKLVEQFERDKKQLQERLGVIQRLVGSQGTPVRLLDGVSQVLPEEAWLAGLSAVSGKLVIQGYARSHFAVADFMDALGRLHPLITNVELNFSERQLFENRPVERFEIVATLGAQS